MNAINICVPTYNEFDCVKNFFSCIEKSTVKPHSVTVVNANYGDKTSKYLNEIKDKCSYKLIEIRAETNDYWSKSVNIGIKSILSDAIDFKWIVLVNVDTFFREDTISKITNLIQCASPFEVHSGICFDNFRSITSGVSVKSKFFPLMNLQHFDQLTESKIKSELLVESDFLPGRLLIFNELVINRVGYIDEKNLPHYHSDYEFTYRAKKNGFKLFVNSSIRADHDTKNTGKKFDKEGFFSSLFKVTNQSNPIYRVKFAYITFEFPYNLTAVFVYILKTIYDINRAIVIKIK